MRESLHFIIMPLPVNAERIHALLREPYNSSKLSAEVSFVGSLYNESHNLYDSLHNISNYAKGYLDALMQHSRMCMATVF